MEMILDKKQIRGFFLFEFKMGHKAVETTPNINNTFGPGTGNKRTVQWWFQNVCKGDKSLEDEECNGQPLEVVWQLRHHQSWSSYNYTEVAKELNIDHSSHLAFEAYWKAEKAQ